MKKQLLFPGLLLLIPTLLSAQQLTEFRRFSAPNATQGVAVDDHAIYTISNSKIVKYDKKSLVRLDSHAYPLIHLNAGTVLDGRLYCAHSNYPALPMVSSVEVFDTATLAHLGTHSFGIYQGSLVWVDRYQGHWYALFAQYENQAGEPGRGVAYTTLVKFDAEWRQLAGWTLPKKLIERIRPMNLSGGLITADGQIICSPHHDMELYYLRFPAFGSELEWTRTLPAPFEGQAIDADPTDPQVIYGIHRHERAVIAVRVGE